MNSLQKKLYVMLNDFDEICKRNNITYYLAGGSALGAIRNNGYLPWDDDLDVYITRDNWEKLKKVPASQYPENRKLIHKDNTEYYSNPIPRFVDTESTLIYPSQVICGKACGQHIELLILDPMPNGVAEQEDYKKTLAVYTEILTPYFIVNQDMGKNNGYFDFHLYQSYLSQINKYGRESVLKDLEKKLFSFSEEECQDYCMRWGITILVYPKSFFGEPVYEQFEGQAFPIAKKARTIFRIAYGDTWMYVPEVHEQEVHGSYSDIEIPFQVYVDDYLPAINQIDAFNDCLHQNRESVIMKYHEMHMDKRLNQIRARCLSLELEQRIDLNILKSYINECSFLKAKEYIKPFMQAQFQKPFLSMNIMIHLSESLREEIIKLLLLLGDYSKVNQLCELYGFHHCLSQKLESYHTIAFQFKAISQAIYDDPDVRFVQNLIL